MAGDMTIAIIIPIYNQAEYLRTCLDSLVAQTDGDFTAYCVNDGSTDGSQSIIDEYAARDARFVPVRQPNRGLSAARNAGLAAAEERGGADAYMFLDSDDFLHAQCIEFVRRAAKEHPGCVIEFDYTSRPSADEFRRRAYGYDPSSIRSCRSTGTVWNKLYPLSVLGDCRFAEDVRYAEDIVFTTELALKRHPSYFFLPVELLYYTTNPNSMSRGPFDAENFSRRVGAIERLVCDFTDDPSGLRALVEGPLPSLLKRFYRDLVHRVRPDEFIAARQIFARECASLARRGLLLRDRSSFKDIKYYLILRWLAFRYGKSEDLNVVRIWGGLGNQMFQYAFGCALARTSGVPTYYDLSWFSKDRGRAYGLDCFRGEVAVIGGKKALWLSRDNWFVRLMGFGPSLTRFRESPENVYCQGLLTVRNHYIRGYFQVAKYYDAIREQLLKAFRLRDIPLEVLNFERMMRACEPVSLHVRRGDYLKSSDYWLCNESYYARAVSVIRKLVEAPRFFVFSDDLPWCRRSLDLPSETVFVDVADSDHPEFDLYLMSRCRHNIIANSSFSWWGAWLNENQQKRVVAPARWFVDGRPTDILSELWIRI